MQLAHCRVASPHWVNLPQTQIITLWWISWSQTSRLLYLLLVCSSFSVCTLHELYSEPWTGWVGLWASPLHTTGFPSFYQWSHNRNRIRTKLRHVWSFTGDTGNVCTGGTNPSLNPLPFNPTQTGCSSFWTHTFIHSWRSKGPNCSNVSACTTLHNPAAHTLLISHWNVVGARSKPHDKVKA